MKLSRIIATGAAFALLGTAGLLGATSANAADFYVTTPLPAETSPYPAGWFAGGVAPGGSATSTPSGISLVGQYQILDGTTPTTGLTSLVAGAGFNVVSGTATFQIPLFGNAQGADMNYTTLYPNTPGDAGLSSGTWTTTGKILASDGVTVLYAANAVAPLADFQTALAQSPYKILAFGAIVNAGDSAVIASITWDGNTHWFLPTPTATLSPKSLTVTDTATPGKSVTAVLTGFLPGESVSPYFSTGAMGGPFGSAVIADSNGKVTFTYTPDAKMAVGTYYLGGDGETSGANVSVAFTVVADTLAATGVESAPFIVSGGILLLLGAGLVVGMATMRRRLAVKR